MNNEKNYNIDKNKIINNSIVAITTVVFSVIILVCLYIVVKPILEEDNVNNSSIVESNDLKRIQEVIDNVSTKYVDEIDKEKLIEGAIKGITASTDDPYTRYMDEEEYQELITSGTEVYNGLGVHVTFESNSNSIMILGIMPNSPALKADLRVGDLIVKVDDTEVTSQTYNDCVDNLKGEKGTTVKITIKRENQELIEKQIVRDEIKTNNVSSEILDGNIGYIKIWAFENDIYNQFKEQYDELINKKVKGIVLDLRNNPGGLVDQTIEISKLFLPKCDIVRLVYRDGKEKVYKCDGKKANDLPLAVLVNSRTASAAEILSGAIKDSNRGVLIGNKTYGKGIVQTIEHLNNSEGALSITTAKYYTSSGVEIHKNGIEPNETVDLPEEYKNVIAIPNNFDTQLKRAVEYINSKQ